jgi:hypothetical protein
MARIGAVIGKPGGSLRAAASWSNNIAAAKAGVRGEISTAKILDGLAALPGGPTVLHDLRIPIPGINANIDHIVVSGRNVTIIDSKVWKPGFYWTFAGMTFRGAERFTPADKQTMPMAHKAINGLLLRARLRANVRKPLLVVWPSNSRNAMKLLLLRSPGTKAMTADRFTTKAASAAGAKAADPQLVEQLRHLVLSNTPAPRSAQTVPFGPNEL